MQRVPTGLACVQNCNIFAGKESCKELPADSPFGRTCKADRQDLKTDCIYYKDAEAKMSLDPGDSMSNALGDSYPMMKQHCPQCLRNMQAMVCASDRLCWVSCICATGFTTRLILALATCTTWRWNAQCSWCCIAVSTILCKSGASSCLWLERVACSGACKCCQSAVASKRLSTLRSSRP